MFAEFKKIINYKICEYIYKRGLDEELRRGYRMAIFANDWIGINVNQFGIYERDDLEFLMNYLKPLHELFEKSDCLDVGANIGNHSLFFSKYFSNIFSFEPNLRTYKLLELNAMEVDNIFAFNFGLGDENGKIKIHEVAGNAGGASLKYANGSFNGLYADVKRLSDLDISMKNVSFMKIDVEGFEDKVIAGSLELIKRCSPVVVLEQLQSEFVGGTTESLSMLRQLGYKFCWKDRGLKSDSWIVRRFYDVYQIFFARKDALMFGAHLPPDNYSMIIAIPPIYQDKLGMK